MSQVYVKRCDRCGEFAISPNVPVPPGWQSLADMMYGTLASVDICPRCQEVMGIRELLKKAVHNRAIGEMRAALLNPEIPTADIEELEARIEAGEFDEAFAQGQGIDLHEELPAAAELVEENVDA